VQLGGDAQALVLLGLDEFAREHEHLGFGAGGLGQSAQFVGHGVQQVALLQQKRPLVACRAGLQVADLDFAQAFALDGDGALLAPGSVLEILGGYVEGVHADACAGDLRVLPGVAHQHGHLADDLLHGQLAVLRQPRNSVQAVQLLHALAQVAQNARVLLAERGGAGLVVTQPCKLLHELGLGSARVEHTHCLAL